MQVRSHRPRFRHLAAQYDRLRPEGAGDHERARRLLEGLRLGASGRILEIGCGTGKLTFPLAQLTPARIDGVDIETAMLAVARRKDSQGRITWHRASATALPFPDRTFHLVFMSLVMHHLDRPVDAYREIHRVLTPAGQLRSWTFTPAHFRQFFLNQFFPSIARIDEARFPTAAATRRDLRAAGFSEVRMSLFNDRTAVRLDVLEERVRHRYITTLDLVPAREFRRGLERVQAARRQLGGQAELPNRLRWRLIGARKARAGVR